MPRYNNRSACAAFAKLGSMLDKRVPTTGTALSFRTYAAFSYAEPIAYVRSDNTLLVTDAKFPVTTSKHTGMVASAWAIEHGRDSVRSVPHSELRAYCRAVGYSVGSRGAGYDRCAA